MFSYTLQWFISPSDAWCRYHKSRHCTFQLWSFVYPAALCCWSRAIKKIVHCKTSRGDHTDLRKIKQCDTFQLHINYYYLANTWILYNSKARFLLSEASTLRIIWYEGIFLTKWKTIITISFIYFFASKQKTTTVMLIITWLEEKLEITWTPWRHKHLLPLKENSWVSMSWLHGFISDWSHLWARSAMHQSLHALLVIQYLMTQFKMIVHP